LLVTDPLALLTLAVNCAPLSEVLAGGVVYVEEVAPLIDAPLRRHRYASGAVPVAATLKVWVSPAAIVTLAGAEVIAGRVAVEPEVLPDVPPEPDEVTVSHAVLLVMLPEALDTITL
jgi:hypothetical protein